MFAFRGRSAIAPLIALAFFVPLAALAQAPRRCPITEIHAPAGPLCGFHSSISLSNGSSASAHAYLGIPYAQAPTPENNLRWKNPVALAPWTALRHATQYGNICPQTAIPGRDPGKSCSLSTNQGFQSEDCLYLNVWAPATTTPASKLPVMVFIPGGAYHVGSGGATTSSNLYDGTYLADSGNVIVVTFNYRLGVLGFLAIPEMESGGGNFGFRDQLMALRWVQQNIESFGGDPGQVTLFGESAGAISVGLHALSSPQSAGLFKAALMESNTLGLPYRNLQQAHALGARYRELLDCHDLKCLETRTACELVARETSPCLNPTSPTNLLNVFMYWTPVIDGSLITDQPMAKAADLKVPMLMGTNQTEGVFFADKMTQGAGYDVCTMTPQLYYAAVKDYKELLDGLFGEQSSRRIREIPRYHCAAAPCTSQLANVITDYIFTCASRDLATRAGKAQNLYMYLFDQITSFNLWGPSAPACQGQVCHGAEIPYVFNTPWAGGHAFQPAEETLSQTMGRLWVSFAKSQSPGSAWPLFLPNKTYRLLNEVSSTADDPLNTTAHCTSLWDTIGYQNSAAWKRGE